MNVVLHVDLLILSGASLGVPNDPQYRALVGGSFELELSRLVAADGLSRDLREIGLTPELRVSAPEWSANEPRGTGECVARAVYGGIGA